MRALLTLPRSVTTRIEEYASRLTVEGALSIAHPKLNKIEIHKSLSAEAKQNIDNLMFCAVEFWFKTILNGGKISEEARNIFSGHGRLCVHKGASLYSLMYACEVSVREIWQDCVVSSKESIDITREILLNISKAMFMYLDEITKEIIPAYIDEQLKNNRCRDNLHRQLEFILTHPSQDEGDFREILISLGLDPSTPRTAMALDISFDTEKSTSRDNTTAKLLLQASRIFQIPVSELISTWHCKQLIVWLPCIHGETISHNDQRIAKGANALLVSAPAIRRIGLGIMNHGAKGWARSLNESIKALNFRLDYINNHNITHYSSILIEDCIRSDSYTLHYLNSLLEQLDRDPNLLATLETYMSLGRHRSCTAKRIGIHPNTLDYRLSRIEQILCASLESTSWISRLDVALKLRRQSINKSFERRRDLLGPTASNSQEQVREK
ncbi:PucR family transcriptional regulator [Pseudomonas aeruginosa]